MAEIEEHVERVGSEGAKWLRSKYAGVWLGVISFAESVVFPVPIDPFLIALILARRDQWVRYITISITTSVLGGVFAYVLGAYFFEAFGERFISFAGLEDQFASISNSLNQDAFVFVLLGALTPILPYKIVTIASGLLQVNFLAFLVASIIGRILRLGIIGYMAYALGPQALETTRRHMTTIAYVMGAILLGYILLQIFSG